MVELKDLKYNKIALIYYIGGNAFGDIIETKIELIDLFRILNYTKRMNNVSLRIKFEKLIKEIAKQEGVDLSGNKQED